MDHEYSSDLPLFFAKFADGGTYAVGEQRHPELGVTPPGPIGYVSRQMAQEAADVVEGHVEEKTLLEAVRRCLQLGAVLYVRYEDAETAVVPITVNVARKRKVLATSRIHGYVRQKLIRLAEDQKRRASQI